MAIEKKIIIDVDTVKAAGGLDNLKKSLKETNKEVENTSESTQAMSNTLDKATGGAVSKFKALKGALGTAVTGFKSLRVAIIGTGIGALLIAVTSLGQAFTRSEEGQNKFAKLLGVIGSVTGNLLDLLADLGEGIISVFENPKQALIDFKDLLVTNITNRFKAILDTVGFLGSAISKVFSKDFKGALEDAKKAGSSFVDSFTGVENSIDKASNAVKNFNKEIVEDAKAAAKIADQRARAEKLARNLIVERAEAERNIAELREKAADKENFTAQERIEFLKEAGAISEDLANKETEVARLRLEAKQTENALTKSNKADLDEEAQLKADLINKDTQRLKLQKALTAELTTATREANKTTKEGADKDVMTEEQKQDAIEKIQKDYIKKKEDRDANTELKKIELEEQRKLAELERLNATETQKMEVEAYYNQLRDEVRATQNAKQLEETKKLNEELAQAEVNLQQAKAGAIQGGLQVIGMLAGKSKGVAKTLLVVEKGLAIAQVISNAARAIAQAKANLAATPAVIGLVPNPAYLIQAAATAKGIISTKLTAATSIATIAAQAVAGLGGGGGGGGASVGGLGGAGGGASTQPQAPSFNIVGATETSQLAGAIGGQTQQPVQAYVVSNDVTTAQSLENNIVEGATL
ncbi:hypothetical protein [uncultured Polaribacter sp.]|uniref:hypothetical protein n=1 Tax=uncultured Polaribacter sp. TaxID=174711 RepID=UPI00259B7F71|nr:hypothetical protein [uncultured Polaribacter sp.]